MCRVETPRCLSANMTLGVGEQNSPRGPPDVWPTFSGSHQDMYVCDGQMGEKERLNSLRNCEKKQKWGMESGGNWPVMDVLPYHLRPW